MEKTICLRKERFFGNYDETYFTFNKNGTITIVRHGNYRGGGASSSIDFKDAIKSRDEFDYIMEEIEELITEEKTTYEEIYEHIKNGMHNKNKWYILLAEYCAQKLGMSEKQVFEEMNIPKEKRIYHLKPIINYAKIAESLRKEQEFSRTGLQRSRKKRNN